jgi:chromatin structure-remodeling complex subunit RSC9
VTSHPPSSQQQQQFRGASTSYNPSSNMENMSHAVTNYEPRPQMPLTLRPVVTPGNNPVEWMRRQRVLKEHAGSLNARPPPPKVVLPGSKFSLGLWRCCS